LGRRGSRIWVPVVAALLVVALAIADALTGEDAVLVPMYVLGPLLASVFLFVYPGEYRTLFTLTLIPGAIVMLVLWRVPDTRRASPPADTASSVPGIRELPSAYYRALAVIMLFTLGNASDAFLLLRLSDLGIAAFWIPLLWSALHVVKVIASLGGGAAFVGRVRDDELGRVFAHDINASGVRFETPLVTDGLPTGRSLILVTPDAERTLNTFLGAASEQGVAAERDDDPLHVAPRRVRWSVSPRGPAPARPPPELP